MLLANKLKSHPNSLFMRTKDGCEYCIEVQGLLIGIENPEGSVREGEGWKTTYFHPYGFIAGTKGADDEEIDCFVGNHPDSEDVYIVNQQVDGQFDEHKVMLGFDNQEAARDAYLAHYDTQELLGSITHMPISEFKKSIGL